MFKKSQMWEPRVERGSATNVNNAEHSKFRVSVYVYLNEASGEPASRAFRSEGRDRLGLKPATDTRR